MAKIKSKKSKGKDMTMKWADLMAGDTLQFNPEYIEKVKTNTNLYKDEKDLFIKNANTRLTISSIDIIERSIDGSDSITLYFKSKAFYSFSIDQDGIPRNSLYRCGKTPLFIIIGLAKE